MTARRDRAAHGWSNLKERLSSQVWPLTVVVLAGVLGIAALVSAVDDRVRDVTWLRFPGGPDSARSLLSSIASAMITFTALVFTITIVVLQLASQQFSPRVLRTFLRDRTSQVALALFASTFTYALLVLRQITPDRVPPVSVSFSVVLVLASVVTFIGYISHMANAVRASTIIASVAEETRDTIDAGFYAVDDVRTLEPRADDHEEAQEWRRRTASDVVLARRHGVLVGVDVARAVDVATRVGGTLVVHPSIGDFVPEGTDVLRVLGPELGDRARHEIAKCITIQKDRTMQQDVAFGLRQLVDIAERALSPSLNDPTTAVQATDHIHDLLRRLCVRRFPPEVHRDDDGHVRLVAKVPSWDELVTLAVSEIRSYGARSIQVHRRLRAMLLDLRSIAPVSRRAALDRELEALEAVEPQLVAERDKELARDTDLQGLGS